MIGHFTNPQALLLLLLLPVYILLWGIDSRHRKKTLTRLLAPQNRKRLIPRQIKRDRLIYRSCLATAFILIVLAMARPVWGTKPTPQPGIGRDLIFMLDVSQSMLAQDQPPSRLEYAKKLILQCLDTVQSGRVSLVAFAGSTAIKCPLTSDFNFLRHTLMDLEPDSVAVGGTRLGDAIAKTAEKLITASSNNVCDLILITDGESHTPINTNAVQQIADSGINVMIIGLGSDTIPATIPINHHDHTTPLKQNGKTIYTKQASQRLEIIAAMIPNAIYINAGTNSIDLADIYHSHAAGTIAAEQKIIERPIERYRSFFLVAIIFLLTAFVPRILRPTSTRKQAGAIVLLAIIILPTQSRAESRANLFKAGLSAYKSGNYKAAAEKFSEAQKQKTSPAISYNLGTAYYRLGDMSSAADCFMQATDKADSPSIAANAAYNAGNALFMQAIHTPDIPREQVIEGVLNAIAMYQSALAIQPKHEDAAANLASSQKVLTMLRQSNDNQTDQQDADSDDQNNQDQDQQKASDKDSKSSSSEKKQQDEDKELKPPNLTPDDIIKEENKNNLNRSRKKHADFGKVKMNW